MTGVSYNSLADNNRILCGCHSINTDILLANREKIRHYQSIHSLSLKTIVVLAITQQPFIVNVCADNMVNRAIMSYDITMFFRCCFK